MQAPDDLNERQQELIAQVRQGEIEEREPDTEVQLLALARLGHLAASHDGEGWHFTPTAEPDAIEQPEAAPEGEPQGEPESAPPAPPEG